MNPALVAGVIITIGVIALPLALAFMLRRRLGVGWRYFAYGALIFFLFEASTHWWINQGNWAPVLQGWAGGSKAFFIVLLFGWALSNGLCEEVGRHVGYRWLMHREEKTWTKAVMYGTGHGGYETIVASGLPTLASLVLGAGTGAPLLLALGLAWGRIVSATPLHIAWSVVVLQVFRRNNIGWLWIAVLTHAVVGDFVPFLLLYVLNIPASVNVLWPVYGAISLWAIWKLRDRPTQSTISITKQVALVGETNR